MADLIIRGVKMPNSCEKCPFNDHEEGFCFAAWKFNESGWPEFSLNVGRQETRHHRCPIGQLPEGHGRMIDGDAPIRICGIGDGKGYYPIYDTTPIKMLLNQCVGDLPKTIIPAEGGGEDG